MSVMYFEGDCWNKKRRGKKFNFVDKNNVMVGFDSQDQCCEDFEWSVLEGSTSGKEIKVFGRGVTVLNDYEFCTETGVIEFPSTTRNEDHDDKSVAFKMVSDLPDKKDLYLVFSNSHNGYYSHGYHMETEDKVFAEGSI